MSLDAMLPPGFTRPMPGQTPVGSVIAYAGEISQPAMNQAGPPLIETMGWMVCDGRLLDAISYPELFATIAYRYGGQGNQFRIPDYRRTPSATTGTEIPSVNDINDAAYIIKYTSGFVP